MQAGGLVVLPVLVPSHPPSLLSLDVLRVLLVPRSSPHPWCTLLDAQVASPESPIRRIVEEAHTQVHDEAGFLHQPSMLSGILFKTAHTILTIAHDCLHGACSFLPGSLSATHKGRQP